MADDFFDDDLLEETKEEKADIGKHDGEEDEVDEDKTEYEGTEADEEESSESEEGEGEDEEEKDKAFIEETWGEMPGEGGEEGGEEEEEVKKQAMEEEGEEELEEEQPPDPNAPYDLSDESEAQKAPFKLNDDQMAEVVELWELYQNYTPAYAYLDGYITPKELIYMLKALNLHTHTPEQMQELIDFCVRPPHPEDHINFDQFLWIVTIRQRDMPIEEEVRLALEVFDPTNSGIIDREYLRETLKERGYKMKTADVFIKEVDMANDGTLGLEDIVNTICVDLSRDDIEMLYNQIYPPEEKAEDKIDELVS